MQLVAILREVKYLETTESESPLAIPDSAKTVFSRNEEFHKYCANLDLTVAWYNQVRETILEVEYPLIEVQLKTIDSQLEQAEKTLTWNSSGEPFVICFVLYFHYLTSRDNFVSVYFSCNIF